MPDTSPFSNLVGTVPPEWQQPAAEHSSCEDSYSLPSAPRRVGRYCKGLERPSPGDPDTLKALGALAGACCVPRASSRTDPGSRASFGM